MDCTETRENYSEYVEGTDKAVKSSVEEHLRGCPKCRSEVAKLDGVINLLHSLPEVNPPPGLLVGINERIDELERGGLIPAMRKFFGGSFGLSKAVAMAATLVLVFLGTFYLSGNIPGGGSESFDEIAKNKASAAVAEPAAIMEKAYAPAVDMVASTPRPAAPSLRTMESEAGVVLPRSSASGAPSRSDRMIRSVSYNPNPIPSMDNFPPAPGEMFGAATVPGANIRRVDIPAPSKSKPLYPDHIIVIKSNDVADTIDQVLSNAIASEAKELSYSYDARFFMVPIEQADHFIQALETLGTDVVRAEGPLDRTDAQAFLIEVIVIPSGP